MAIFSMCREEYLILEKLIGKRVLPPDDIGSQD